MKKRQKIKILKKKPIPENLYKIFLKVRNNDWKDDKLFKKYQKLVDDYLGTMKDDSIERSRLVIRLTRVFLGKMTLGYKDIE